MQRAGKTHSAALTDSDRIKFGDLLKYLKAARDDLAKFGEEDSALRFELMEESLRARYKGGTLEYRSRDIGI